MLPVRATLPRARSWISLRQRFPGCSKAIRTGSEAEVEGPEGEGEGALAPQRRTPKPEVVAKVGDFSSAQPRADVRRCGLRARVASL